jgi:hypothetical protein
VQAVFRDGNRADADFLHGKKSIQHFTRALEADAFELGQHQMMLIEEAGVTGKQRNLCTLAVMRIRLIRLDGRFLVEVRHTSMMDGTELLPSMLVVLPCIGNGLRIDIGMPEPWIAVFQCCYRADSLAQCLDALLDEVDVDAPSAESCDLLVHSDMFIVDAACRIRIASNHLFLLLAGVDADFQAVMIGIIRHLLMFHFIRLLPTSIIQHMRLLNKQYIAIIKRKECDTHETKRAHPRCNL